MSPEKKKPVFAQKEWHGSCAQCRDESECLDRSIVAEQLESNQIKSRGGDEVEVEGDGEGKGEWRRGETPLTDLQTV